MKWTKPPDSLGTLSVGWTRGTLVKRRASTGRRLKNVRQPRFLCMVGVVVVVVVVAEDVVVVVAVVVVMVEVVSVAPVVVVAWGGMVLVMGPRRSGGRGCSQRQLCTEVADGVSSD